MWTARRKWRDSLTIGGKRTHSQGLGKSRSHRGSTRKEHPTPTQHEADCSKERSTEGRPVIPSTHRSSLPAGGTPAALQAASRHLPRGTSHHSSTHCSLHREASLYVGVISSIYLLKNNSTSWSRISEKKRFYYQRGTNMRIILRHVGDTLGTWFLWIQILY